MSSSAKNRPRAALAAALLPFALSGCAQQDPGVMAYVGSDTVSVRQLDDAVAGVSAALGGESRDVRRAAVVDALIRGEIAEQVAQARKITITNAAREALFTDQTGKQLLSNPQARQVAYDLADEQIVVEKIGSQAYLNALRSARVKLNPRYGVWDPAAVSAGTAVQDRSTSLSVPAQQ